MDLPIRRNLGDQGAPPFASISTILFPAQIFSFLVSDAQPVVSNLRGGASSGFMQLDHRKTWSGRVTSCHDPSLLDQPASFRLYEVGMRKT